ncbi:hypothetical protein MMC29_007041, partial [Sticta canariensis]|nr:hypothetical protein [Sticta canariensis]
IRLPLRSRTVFSKISRAGLATSPPIINFNLMDLLKRELSSPLASRCAIMVLLRLVDPTSSIDASAAPSTTSTIARGPHSARRLLLIRSCSRNALP